MNSNFSFSKLFTAMFFALFLSACSLLYNPFSNSTYRDPNGGFTPVLYDDALHATISHTWGCSVNTDETTYKIDSFAIRFQVTAGWGGFGLSKSAPYYVDSTYSHLRFYINGGLSSNQRLRVYMRDQSGGQIGSLVAINSYIEHVNAYVEAGIWKEVLIPLSAFSATPQYFKTLLFQDDNNSTFTVYLDNISFCNLP